MIVHNIWDVGGDTKWFVNKAHDLQSLALPALVVISSDHDDVV